MIRNKFVDSNTLRSERILLLNDTWLRSFAQDDVSIINIVRVNSLNQIEFTDIPYVQSMGRLALLSEAQGVAFEKEEFAILEAPTENLELELGFTPRVNSQLIYVKNGPILNEDEDYELAANIVTLLITSEKVQLLNDTDAVIVQYGR